MIMKGAKPSSAALTVAKTSVPQFLSGIGCGGSTGRLLPRVRGRGPIGFALTPTAVTRKRAVTST